MGRPTSQEAVQAAQQALRREDDNDPPSVRLNEDVQHIMRQVSRPFFLPFPSGI